MTFSPITNLLMERKNPKPKANTNEFDLIKAAAWAWYERGSGSEGKLIPEFDFTTSSHRIPKPSRYKIEAMKNKASEKDPRSSTSISTNVSPSPSFRSSLLDTYEIESISRELGNYVESSNHDGGGGRGRSIVVLGEIEGGEMVDKVKKKKSVKKGFWLRQGVVCGSKDDVVVPGTNIIGRRQPEKRFTAV